MYMSESCTGACGTCDRKQSACDRPDATPPLVQQGGVAATMQRILDEFPQYNPRALSRPGHGPKGDASPWVIALESFVSDEEARATALAIARLGCLIHALPRLTGT
jgi:hypothetical protein